MWVSLNVTAERQFHRSDEMFAYEKLAQVKRRARARPCYDIGTICNTAQRSSLFSPPLFFKRFVPGRSDFTVTQKVECSEELGKQLDIQYVKKKVDPRTVMVDEVIYFDGGPVPFNKHSRPCKRYIALVSSPPCKKKLFVLSIPVLHEIIVYRLKLFVLVLLAYLGMKSFAQSIHR